MTWEMRISRTGERIGDEREREEGEREGKRGFIVHVCIALLLCTNL